MKIAGTEQKNLSFFSNFFQRFLKTIFYMSKEPLQVNTFSLIKKYFLSNWEVELEKHKLLPNIVSAGLRKLDSMCPEEHFQETSVWNFTNFSFTFRLLSKNFRLFVKIFSVCCQKRVRWVKKIILRKLFYPCVKNEYSFSCIISMRTPFFSRIFFVKVRRTNFNMSEKHMEKTSLKVYVFIIFR